MLFAFSSYYSEKNAKKNTQQTNSRTNELQGKCFYCLTAVESIHPLTI